MENYTRDAISTEKVNRKVTENTLDGFLLEKKKKKKKGKQANRMLSMCPNSIPKKKSRLEA